MLPSGWTQAPTGGPRNFPNSCNQAKFILPSSGKQTTSSFSRCLLTTTQNSYPVSPDVGKVGNESPTFIEPISQRKDGIMAMFANQGSQTSKSSPVKRKRSTPPPPPSKKPKKTIPKEESIEFLGFGFSNPKVRGTRSMNQAITY